MCMVCVVVVVVVSPHGNHVEEWFVCHLTVLRPTIWYHSTEMCVCVCVCFTETE